MVKDTSMQRVHRNDAHGSRGLRSGWVAWGAALLLAVVATACDPETSPELAGKAEARPAIAAETKGLGNPLGELVPPKPGQEQLVGVVSEHLPAGGYTYLWVEPERGEPRWVVTMRRDVGAGDRVCVDSLGSRQDFYSRRLDRRFAELVFGVVEIVG
jgi:hypothetical protein